MGKTSINCGHELLPGVSYPEWLSEDFRNFKLKKWGDFRIAMSDYGNVNAVLYSKFYAKRLREFFPNSIIIWGTNKKNNQWKSSEWNVLRAEKILQAQYAQTNNLWYQLFNEDTDSWCRAPEVIVSSTKSGSTITCSTGAVKHGLVAGDKVIISGIGSVMSIGASSETVGSIVDDYTFTFNPVWPGTDGTTTGGSCMPNPALVRDRYKTLAADLRTMGITVPLIGSIGQGGLSTWMAGDTNITLAFNIYGEGASLSARLANFKSQVDTFITIPQPTGALKIISEFGVHATFSSYPTVYADQVNEIKERREYAESKVDLAFFHCWRSNSWSGSQNDNFAMRLTWGTSFAPSNIRWEEAF